MVNTTAIREEAMKELVHMFVGKRITLRSGTMEELRHIIQAAITKTWIAYREEKQNDKN